MKFTLQPTPDDYIAARWLAMRPHSSLLYLGYAACALYVITLLVDLPTLLRGQMPELRFWVQLGAGAYIVISFFAVMSAQIRKIFKQQKSLHVESIIEFTDTHMLVSSECGSVRIQWSDFLKWKRNKKIVLLHQSEVLTHMLPLRCFFDGISQAEVFSLIESKMGKPES